MAKREFNFTKALATLGERFQDDGNGAMRVITHAGLVVSLTIRERHPSEAAQRLLIEINDLRRVGRALPTMLRGYAKTPLARARYEAQQALLRRKLIEASGGVLRLLRVTRAGRIAAARFLVMLLKAKKREPRAAAAKKKGG